MCLGGFLWPLFVAGPSIDRALQDIPDEAEEVAEPKGSDCDALRPLALKIAKFYKPCAVVVKKTELMEGLADTHGIWAKRKEDIVTVTGL